MSYRQTSILAYRQIEKELGPRQKLVLEALEEIAPANDRQIAEHLHWPINTVTPRRGELLKKREIEVAYVGRDTTGRSATFWKTQRPDNEYTDIA